MAQWRKRGMALVLASLWIPNLAITDPDQERAKAALPRISFAEFDYGVPTFVKKANVARMGQHLMADDVVVCSFPKSGTNWVKQIVHIMRLRADPELLEQYADTDLSETINWPEAIEDFDFDKTGTFQPRAFFSHLPWQDMPRGARYIYVMRDMPSVVASFFKYTSSFGGTWQNHDVNDAAQLMMDGLLFYGRWESHVASFFEQRNNPKVLLVKYEDLKEDHVGQVLRIAQFLQFNLTREELSRVSEMSTLAYMHGRNAKIQGKEWVANITGNEVKDDYKLVNDGKSGSTGFRPEIAVAMKDHYRTKAAPLLGGLASYSDFRVHGGHEEL